MAQYMTLAFHDTGVVQDADTPMTSFVPDTDGRIKKVIIIPGGVAATTLIECGYVKITSAQFGGVDSHHPFQSAGLRTVPHLLPDWKCETECDLKIMAGKPVKGFYYYNVTPTTPELMVYFLIES